MYVGVQKDQHCLIMCIFTSHQYVSCLMYKTSQEQAQYWSLTMQWIFIVIMSLNCCHSCYAYTFASKIITVCSQQCYYYKHMMSLATYMQHVTSVSWKHLPKWHHMFVSSFVHNTPGILFILLTATVQHSIKRLCSEKGIHSSQVISISTTADIWANIKQTW